MFYWFATRIKRIDFDDPAEAVRLVGMARGIETLVVLVPTVPKARLGNPIATLAVEDTQLLITVDNPFHISRRIDKVPMKIFLAGQVCPPGGRAMGAVIQRPQHHGAGRIGSCFEEGMSGRGACEAYGGLSRDAPRIRGGAYDRPAAPGQGHLDHRHAMSCLRLGDFLRGPGLHATDVQQPIVSVFVIDSEQPAGRVL
jgi:hypothetical protein